MTKTAPAKAKRPKITWIINTNKNEFHRLIEGEAHPGQCHFDEILDEHKEKVKTAREARERKVDAAKFCNKRFKSRENT
jgi:hypothetical protein